MDQCWHRRRDFLQSRSACSFTTAFGIRPAGCSLCRLCRKCSVRQPPSIRVSTLRAKGLSQSALRRKSLIVWPCPALSHCLNSRISPNHEFASILIASTSQNSVGANVPRGMPRLNSTIVRDPKAAYSGMNSCSLYAQPLIYFGSFACMSVPDFRIH